MEIQFAASGKRSPWAKVPQAHLHLVFLIAKVINIIPFWYKFLSAEEEVTPLLHECGVIRKMIIKSINTANKTKSDK